MFMRQRSLRFKLAFTLSLASISLFFTLLFCLRVALSQNSKQHLVRLEDLPDHPSLTLSNDSMSRSDRVTTSFDSPFLFSSISHSRTFGIASRVFVLSLPQRVDRRMAMNALSRALVFEFDYIDGVEASDEAVDRALYVLKMKRHAARNHTLSENRTASNAFDFEEYASGDETMSSLAQLDSPTSLASVEAESVLDFAETLGILCATPEDPFPAPLTAEELRLQPLWHILSRGMVACWIGHLKVLRKIVNMKLDVALVLEDDVDMEFDIENRLMGMWPALPKNGWDIVMLGHCHSNETVYPPLLGAASLRPSFAPKCTHAYAISSLGAARLVQMLSIEGFAHSRALDQAISWLISSGRLRSYSVVPAIIVQSKRTPSDIWLSRTEFLQRSAQESPSEEFGSKWRDVLVDSTLERLQVIENTGRT
ncbi:hypothetical protein K439DRAFT_1633071 [Ramaria rubella]|nr:hypothetical protein K439DRAFT_1633071 [Ramaria rubella]